MSGKEFCLIKELTRLRLTAICAFEPPFCVYLLYGSLLKDTWPVTRLARCNTFYKRNFNPLYLLQYIRIGCDLVPHGDKLDKSTHFENRLIANYQTNIRGEIIQCR